MSYSWELIFRGLEIIIDYVVTLDEERKYIC